MKYYNKKNGVLSFVDRFMFTKLQSSLNKCLKNLLNDIFYSALIQEVKIECKESTQFTHE